MCDIQYAKTRRCDIILTGDKIVTGVAAVQESSRSATSERTQSMVSK